MKAYQLWKSKLRPNDRLPRGKYFRGIRTVFLRERKIKVPGKKMPSYCRPISDPLSRLLYTTDPVVLNKMNLIVNEHSINLQDLMSKAVDLTNNEPLSEVEMLHRVEAHLQKTLSA